MDLDRMGFSFKDITIPKCYCRNLLDAAMDPAGSVAIINEVNKSCTCGANIKTCNNAHHLTALHWLYALRYTTGSLTELLKIGEHALIMAPHEPVV
jgi:hypothetical protein